jgi:tRNA modification GTPase
MNYKDPENILLILCGSMGIAGLALFFRYVFISMGFDYFGANTVFVIVFVIGVIVFINYLELILHITAKLFKKKPEIEFPAEKEPEESFEIKQDLESVREEYRKKEQRLNDNQMRGGFARKLADLRDKLLQFASLIELELDFSEEDVEFANRDHLYNLTLEIEKEIDSLANSFQLGNAIKSGIPVAIIGETNAGKSTLLNLLLNEDKAIVSDIHGTTRDVIEDVVNINGVTFRFIDTAGIRQTSDVVETMGIERTFQKIEQASIILWMIDTTTPIDKIETLAESILPKLKDKQVIILFNKADLLSEGQENKFQLLFPDLDAEKLFISAKKQQNTDHLQELLIEKAGIPSISEDDVIVTNLRHYEALKKALDAIQRVIEGLDVGITHDFLAQDIRECMFYLGEITGQISTDEILGNIFSKFCIGK